MCPDADGQQGENASVGPKTGDLAAAYQKWRDGRNMTTQQTVMPHFMSVAEAELSVPAVRISLRM